MIWNTAELSASHLSRATAIFVVDCCQFGPSWIFGLKMELMVCASLVGSTTYKFLYFSWYYMIVSMIWNNSELSASHLIHATAIFVVDCCQFGPSWMFGLKMELMACANLVGGTTEKKQYFSWPYMIVSIIWNSYELSTSHLSRATAIFVVDCCQFGASWIFGLRMELMACADLVGVKTEQSCLFPDLKC